MPAWSSESFTSGTRLRSSSPSNSRSNSASPPLPWPVGSAASPLSSSPAQHSSFGTFKRSISNLSNSSVFHTHSTLSEQCNPISPVSDGRFTNPSQLPDCNHNRNHNHRYGETTMTTGNDREHDNGNSSAIYHNLNIVGGTKRKFGKKNDDNNGSCDRRYGHVGGCGWVADGILLPVKIIVWYINLVSRIIRRSYETLHYIIWAPILWICAWICVFWVIIQLPLNLLKWFILVLYTPTIERARSERCVLISGGSTLQALHLARNFYKAGARVIVCEVEGLFGLVRFSTACSRFYTVPRPSPGTAAEYVNALKKIVEREKAVYYIPVSCTNDAYYDALAKPHLEIIGCECFVPGAAEVTSLEDPLQLLQRSSSLGLPTPVHFVLNSADDLVRLYERGCFAGTERHIMLAAGPAGMKERTKFLIPSSPVGGPPLQDIRRKLEQYNISESRPWLVIREPGGPSRGQHLVTCTTVKDSRVVANVTCRLDESRGLIPEDRSDVDQWLETFFGRSFSTRFNGHLSFKLAFTAENELGLVPIGCRVGVPLPYLCLTSVHPRLVWRPCRHFSRHNSTNIIVNERYKQMSSNIGLQSSNSFPARTRSSGSIAAAFLDLGANTRITNTATVLDKRDALFVYWDPLPYCVYYHLQFPFRRLAGVIRERPVQHKPPLAVVQ